MVRTVGGGGDRAKVGHWCAREKVGRDAAVDYVPRVTIRLVDIFIGVVAD